MIYYLILKDKLTQKTITICKQTLGGTLLAEEGWDYLQTIIQNHENINFNFEIIDEKNKIWDLDKFLDMIKKYKIIIN